VFQCKTMGEIWSTMVFLDQGSLLQAVSYKHRNKRRISTETKGNAVGVTERHTAYIWIKKRDGMDCLDCFVPTKNKQRSR